MDEKRINRIIETLELIRRRPKMFIAKDAPEVINFLLGFNTACKMLGADPADEKILAQIMLEKGWESTTVATLEKMREQNLDYTIILNEFLNFQIQAWQQELETIPLLPTPEDN